MRFGINFYRTAAVCSVLSAVTTLGLIFLPSFFAPAEGFEGRDGLWDGMYFLLLIGFAIWSLCFGLALLRVSGLGRVVGAFFIAAFLLTFSLLWNELGWGALPEPLASWSYPAIQPLGRILLACGCGEWRMNRCRCPYDKIER